MSSFPTLKDSTSSPLHIAEIRFGEGEGGLGLTICPGKKDLPRKRNRDLDEDLDVIRNWGASAVVTLMEAHEFEFLRVSRLGEVVQELGMRWIHLPIRDVDVPDQRFEKGWHSPGRKSTIASGRRRSRSTAGVDWPEWNGTVGLILVEERGRVPRTAIQQVRKIRTAWRNRNRRAGTVSS